MLPFGDVHNECVKTSITTLTASTLQIQNAYDTADECGSVVRKLALRYGNPRFKSCYDDLGIPWYNFSAAGL